MNNSTELVFILDKSGSMSGLEQDTLGGFNRMLNEQKKLEGECRISTILFDQHVHLLHERMDIREIQPMTGAQYQPSGSTALLDAMGQTINRIGSAQKHTPVAQRAKQVLVVIITDGEENSSREYSRQQVRQMVEHQQRKFDWQFIFLGANMDAITTASHCGIHPGNASTYIADSAGTELNFSVLQQAVVSFRHGDRSYNRHLQSVRNDEQARRHKS